MNGSITSSTKRKSRRFLVIVWKSFWKNVKEEDAERLGNSLYQFVFRRLPGFLSGAIIPRSGLVDREMLSALMNYKPDSASTYANNIEADKFKIGKGHGYDLESLSANTLEKERGKPND